MKKIQKRILCWSIPLFGVGMLVAGIAALQDNGTRYHLFKDAESLYALLHHEVRSGDSLEHVQITLGDGRNLDDIEKKKLSSVIPKLAEMGGFYPDRVEDEDQFVAYIFGEGYEVILQFRGGHLINFAPEEYWHYEPFVTLG